MNIIWSKIFVCLKFMWFAEVVTGVVSNAVSAFLKWLWSLKSTTKPSKGLPSISHFSSFSCYYFSLSLSFFFFLWGLRLIWWCACWIWGNQFSAKHGRSMMKFESGYTVETILDGSKLGIEPYSVGVSSNGEFLVLDSENSNIYKIPSPVSTCKLPNFNAF